MVTSNDLLNSTMDLLDHPARTQRVMGNLITAVTNGDVVVFNAGNTVALVLEAAATLTSGAIDEMRALDRKRYGSSAQTSDDVLRHVSNQDVIGIYSTPARGTFRFVFEVNALIAAAVNESTDGEVKKIILPRHSVVTNGVNDFTFQYPLVIRIYPDRGIQCYWDVTAVSPIEKVVNSTINSRIASDPNTGLRHLVFDIDLPQLTLVSRTDNVDATTGFAKTYQIPDGENFHYCRVFIKNENSTVWSEITVKYGYEVYDPTIPTATVKVLDSAVSVRIPLVYLVNNMINNSIRVDVYTCRGKLDYFMGGFNENAFQVAWKDFGVSEAESVFVAALNKLNGRTIYGIGSVTGGTTGVSTAQLRDRYVRRSQYPQGYAISREQVANGLGSYNAVVGIDNLTDRQYLATRALPAYVEGHGLDEASMKTVTGLGMSAGTVHFNFATMVTSKYIADHGERITIHPRCLFKRTDGKLQLVSDEVIDSLNDRSVTSLEELTMSVNLERYLFTPFHHRVATSGNRMSVDAYYLTNPEVTSKYAVQFNAESKVAASSSGYAVGYRADGSGYTIAIDIQPSAELKALTHNNLNVQLSFIGDQGGPRNFVNGVLVNSLDSSGTPIGDSWIYQFHLESTLDINLANQLIVHKDKVAMRLEKAFDLTIVLSNYVPANANLAIMNEYYDETLFSNYDTSNAYMAITREKIEVKFGSHLGHLWTRCRPMPEETKYQTYDQNVGKVYDTDQFKLNSLQLPELKWNGTTGKYERTIIHYAGDPILDSNGNQEILHYKGEVIKDEYGAPIPVDGVRGIVRQIELLMVDGRYFFANDEISLRYYDAAVATLASWVINDIPSLEKNLINAERSELRFYPLDTMSDVKATVDGGLQLSIATTQYVAVDIYMTDDKYSNLELKDEIAQNSPKIVNTALNNNTVSVQDVESALKSSLGENIISARVTGLFGDRYNTVTIIDNTGSFVLDKRLEIQSNLSLAVVDNIDVRFHRHSSTIE